MPISEPQQPPEYMSRRASQNVALVVLSLLSTMTLDLNMKVNRGLQAKFDTPTLQVEGKEVCDSLVPN